MGTGTILEHSGTWVTDNEYLALL